ncbi:MAG: cysteine desulfurase [Gemmatimonadales bacterium]
MVAVPTGVPGQELTAPLDLARIRADFPVLGRTVHGKPLVYLDNAATAQKPTVVIDALDHFFRQDNANIHRGVHSLSAQATAAYDEVRSRVRAFINASEDREIVFVRGTTEAINLVAQSYGRGAIGAGDEILVSEMEHHSNLVPWQLLADQVGAVIKMLPITNEGELDLEAYPALLGERTKLVAVAHVSNALGTVNPVAAICAEARARRIAVMVDGAQGVPHLPVDVQELGCDFYAFSGHKMFGPTGVGVLYGRAELLDAMPPYQGGGGMIASVSFEGTTYAPIPTRFEAGTPAIAEVIGLGPAIAYLEEIGSDAIVAYEAELIQYAVDQVTGVPGVRLIGTPAERAGAVSLVMDVAHPHDVGTILDQEGIAVRAGHHCCQPVMDHFGLAATVRASFAFYNTFDEVDALVRGLHRVNEMFG